MSTTHHARATSCVPGSGGGRESPALLSSSTSPALLLQLPGTKRCSDGDRSSHKSSGSSSGAADDELEISVVLGDQVYMEEAVIKKHRKRAAPTEHKEKSAGAAAAAAAASAAYFAVEAALELDVGSLPDTLDIPPPLIPLDTIVHNGASRNKETVSFPDPGRVTCILWSKHAAWIAVSGDGHSAINIMDLTAPVGRSLKQPPVPIPAAVSSMIKAFHMVWVCCGDSKIRIIDKTNTSQVVTVDGHRASVTCLVKYSKFVMSYSEDATIRLWDCEGKCTKVVACPYTVTVLTVTGSMCWVGTTEGVCILDLSTQKLVEVGSNNNGSSTPGGSIAKASVDCATVVPSLWSSSGREQVWTAHSNGTVVCWESLLKRVTFSFSSPERVSTMLCLGPHVWSCTDTAKIKVWDVKKFTCINEIEHPSDYAILCLAPIHLHEDSLVFAGTSTGKVDMWTSGGRKHNFMYVTITKASATSGCSICGKLFRPGRPALRCKGCNEIFLHVQCATRFPFENYLCFGSESGSTEQLAGQQPGRTSNRLSCPPGSLTPNAPALTLSLPPDDAQPKQAAVPDSYIQLFKSKPGKAIAKLVTDGFIPPAAVPAPSREAAPLVPSNKDLSTSAPPAVAPVVAGPPGDVAAIAKFLVAHRLRLDPTQVGDYISDKDNAPVLVEFMKLLDFESLDFEMALRKFLRAFSLPGEGQKIDRLMTAFAKRYVECTAQTEQQHAGESFSFSLGTNDADSVYALAVSCTMLNTALHNDMSARKMTLPRWIESNEGLVGPDQGNFPRDVLDHLFYQFNDFPLEFFSPRPTPIMQGMLTKKGNFRPRWCVLYSHCLAEFRKPHTEMKKARRSFPTAAIKLIAVTNVATTFTVYFHQHSTVHGGGKRLSGPPSLADSDDALVGSGGSVRCKQRTYIARCAGSCRAWCSALSKLTRAIQQAQLSSGSDDEAPSPSQSPVVVTCVSPAVVYTHTATALPPLPPPPSAPNLGSPPPCPADSTHHKPKLSDSCMYQSAASTAAVGNVRHSVTSEDSTSSLSSEASTTSSSSSAIPPPPFPPPTCTSAPPAHAKRKFKTSPSVLGLDMLASTGSGVQQGVGDVHEGVRHSQSEEALSALLVSGSNKAS
eukprot:TRINITY_DN1116_c0_g3_i1.p1 TRINITY_DN1116_c0_g3~~TRINITY_DN1116_c0_g3_i1.p1  ORF type:complete len:1117 (-),score=270.42 TRINITY_DN1116_c0_g3_i1:11-3361(-)